MKTTVANESSALQSQLVIAELLAPVDWNSFIVEYWDNMPLHTSVRMSGFVPPATPREVRTLIESGAPWQFRRMPELYLDGHKVAHDDLVDIYVDMDGLAARAPRLKRIRALLEAGATVNAFGQEAHFPKLAEIRQHFARAFGAEVEIGTFYSQKGHQGLAPHYDCVEVFVLQIFGSKRWHVSSQRIEAPLVGYGGGTYFDPSAPHAQIDLEPGDLLYIPRGTFHHAIAISDESLHATVAVKVPSYFDILTVLAKAAPDLGSMRSYLPLSGATALGDVKTKFLDYVAAVMDGQQFNTKFNELIAVRSRG